ncbi:MULTISPECIES: site-specific integrase [Paraburkholderia]|uniref:site-specific integrase n=1 Tax=Paraburkholderia TaxID=1822464 RepID=UPI00224FE5BD|nr:MULTISPECIES: site-specific integrase [Paraburkholderia]MCX4155523.1 site-specific integrase [Paraburkholderia aspalathi]MDN7164931.1 site-specific integrase [Paraburkholderia sp. SECH2]MDQ6393417.1 site-specific integrase [Paraburkholderia aspalathi]
MTNDDVNLAMAGTLARFNLPALPDSVIDRDGRRIDMAESRWRLNTVTDHVSIDWADFADFNLTVNYALRRWAVQLLTQQASASVASAVSGTAAVISGRGGGANASFEELRAHWQMMKTINEPERLRPALRTLVVKAIQGLRARKAMSNFYRLRLWYSWSSEMLPCLGFDDEFALELNEIWVPGRPSQLAVELEDEDCGPLCDTEVTLLSKALAADQSMKRSRLLQRSAVALCLALGRNPANFCLLRETDLRNIVEGYDVPPQWVLSVPRIKKSGVGPRQVFVEERISDDLAKLLRDLIKSNASIDCGDCPRPLFMRSRPDKWCVGTDIGEYAYHIPSKQFAQLLRYFSLRSGLISPRTMRPLNVTPRRLRYTFATTMVELGVCRKVLAVMLDHSDTQHVRVYYALKGRQLTTILDQAAALKLGPLMRLFRGTLVPSSGWAENGSDPQKSIRFTGDVSAVRPVEIGACGQEQLCTLDPPFSCYLCPKFQPYVEADHQAVLNELLASREHRRIRYGSRLSIQLDDVIYAVAQVVQEIEEHVRKPRKKA